MRERFNEINREFNLLIHTPEGREACRPLRPSCDALIAGTSLPFSVGIARYQPE